jgi:hypothetical protein
MQRFSVSKGQVPYMQKKYFHLLLILLVIFISSCRTYRHAYSPAPPNNPAFRYKGESQLMASYSGSDGNNGTGDIQKNQGGDIMGAYAITKELAITGSYYFRKETDQYRDDYVFDSSVVRYNRKMFDLGFGCFIPLTEKRKGTFSMYAGFGSGKFTINDRGIDDTLAPYSRFFEAGVRKIYIQPGFNFWIGENVSVGLTARYSFITFKKISTSYNQREQEYFFFDRMKRKKPTTFEPTFSLEFAIPKAPWLKIYGSTTCVLGWLEDYPSTRAINGSVGVVVGLFKGRVPPNSTEK